MIVGGSAVLTNAIGGATFNGGLSNAATVSLTGDTFFKGAVTNTGAFYWQGAISNNYVQTAGTTFLNDNATITQNATITGGAFNLNGQTYSNRSMIVSGTGILTNAVAGATFNGGVSNAAMVAVTANTFSTDRSRMRARCSSKAPSVMRWSTAAALTLTAMPR